MGSAAQRLTRCEVNVTHERGPAEAASSSIRGTAEGPWPRSRAGWPLLLPALRSRWPPGTCNARSTVDPNKQWDARIRQVCQCHLAGQADEGWLQGRGGWPEVFPVASTSLLPLQLLLSPRRCHPILQSGLLVLCLVFKDGCFLLFCPIPFLSGSRSFSLNDLIRPHSYNDDVTFLELLVLKCNCLWVAAC